MCSIHLQHTVDSHMRRRIHALCHMKTRIHACHMKRKIHACHMRRRIHLLTRPWTLTTDPSFICTGFTLGETSGSVFEATNLSGSVSEAFILSVRARVSKASFIAVLSARACSRLRANAFMSYVEENTCIVSYEDEDTCMPYEEEDTCIVV